MVKAKPKESKKKQSQWMITLRYARNCGVPIVALETPDPRDSLMNIARLYETISDAPVLFKWDLCNGLSCLSIKGSTGRQLLCQMLVAYTGQEIQPPDMNNKGEVLAFDNNVKSATQAPGACLDFLTVAPKNTTFVMYNAHWFMENEGIKQAIWNLRDLFKARSCMLIMMGNSFQLPRELKSDVLTLRQTLPTDDEIAEIAESTWQDAHAGADNTPKLEDVDSIVDTLTGLNAFGVEQVFSLSIRKGKVEMGLLRSQKIMELNRTPGLSVFAGAETFSTIGGCSNIKTFMKLLINGKRRPRLVVFIDEIEKHFAGTGTDMSGVTTSLTGYLLSWMQDNDVTGMIFIGPPGAAKSAMAKATGNEAGILTAQLDFAGMKASYVGESEARLRYGLQVILSMARSNIIFIATCNSITALPPELRRRFGLGTFFFDLPDDDERQMIWDIYRKQYEIPEQELGFIDERWTGAEIKQCCFNAYNLGCSLKQASSFVVPVAISARERIESLRKSAHGNYISASYEGPYQYPGNSSSQAKQTVMEAAGTLFGFTKPSSKE